MPDRASGVILDARNRFKKHPKKPPLKVVESYQPNIDGDD
jgi:hypothetical protein